MTASRIYNKPTFRTEVFDDTLIKTVEERGKTYGEADACFKRMAAIDAIVEPCTDPVVRSALRMVGYKLARLVESPMHFDTVVDIAGYARCIAMIQDGNMDRDSEELTKLHKAE